MSARAEIPKALRNVMERFRSASKLAPNETPVVLAMTELGCALDKLEAEIDTEFCPDYEPTMQEQKRTEHEEMHR